MPALAGWHPGERAVHRKLNIEDDPSVDQLYTYIQEDMPYEHRVFHSSRLPFIPVTTLDDTGRPWGSILSGIDGKPGFIQSPRKNSLVLDVDMWDGDPFLENSKLFGPDNRMLVAGIGIEFSTRRRNKFAGHISKLSHQDHNVFHLEFTVNEAIGNCPKYINVRDLVPYPRTTPKVLDRKMRLMPTDRLPEAAISFIRDSDTVFLGTSYVASAEDERSFPSHVGMNQRGGRPGFMRVSPSDCRTVVLPDFSGNRIMTSLGNIEATPVASLTFVSFTKGDILYLTGNAATHFGPSALRIMPRQNTLTSIYVTGYTLVQNALRVRQRPQSPVQPSPYSPPIRLLAEEAHDVYFDEEAPVSATLTRIEILSSSLAIFTWESSQDLWIKPGQAAVLDFTPVIGSTEYQHMAPRNPASVNDDRVRTWTVSSSSPRATRTFSLTMREKHGGAVTGFLFAVAQRLGKVDPDVLLDARSLELTVRLLGISGDFVLPEPTTMVNDARPTNTSHMQVPKRLLWIAGGIGLTPFLSMLSFLSQSPDSDDWDIALILSTRESDVLLSLIAVATTGVGKRVRLSIDLFSEKLKAPGLNPAIILRSHMGRIPRSFFTGPDSAVDFKNREIFLCGPESFEKSIIVALSDAEIDVEHVRREGFGY